MSIASQSRTTRHSVTLTLLLIEFLDEFIYAAQEAAWPLVRADLGLSYAQLGLLLGVLKNLLDITPSSTTISLPRTREAVNPVYSSPNNQLHRFPVPLGSPR